MAEEVPSQASVDSRAALPAPPGPEQDPTSIEPIRLLTNADAVDGYVAGWVARRVIDAEITAGNTRPCEESSLSHDELLNQGQVLLASISSPETAGESRAATEGDDAMLSIDPRGLLANQLQALKAAGHDLSGLTWQGITVSEDWSDEKIKGYLIGLLAAAPLPITRSARRQLHENLSKGEAEQIAPPENEMLSLADAFAKLGHTELGALQDSPAAEQIIDLSRLPHDLSIFTALRGRYRDPAITQEVIAAAVHGVPLKIYKKPPFDMSGEIGPVRKPGDVAAAADRAGEAMVGAVTRQGEGEGQKRPTPKDIFTDTDPATFKGYIGDDEVAVDIRKSLLSLVRIWQRGQLNRQVDAVWDESIVPALRDLAPALPAFQYAIDGLTTSTTDLAKPLSASPNHTEAGALVRLQQFLTGTHNLLQTSAMVEAGDRLGSAMQQNQTIIDRSLAPTNEGLEDTMDDASCRDLIITASKLLQIDGQKHVDLVQLTGLLQQALPTENAVGGRNRRDSLREIAELVSFARTDSTLLEQLSKLQEVSGALSTDRTGDANRRAVAVLEDISQLLSGIQTISKRAGYYSQEVTDLSSPALAAAETNITPGDSDGQRKPRGKLDVPA